MTEAQHMLVVARYLDACGVLWCHVPNEGKRNPWVGKMLRRQGMKAGVPDVLIFTPPPLSDFTGCAIELKADRPKGSSPSKAQKEWIAGLESVGWWAAVCYGSEASIAFLKELGYRDERGGLGSSRSGGLARKPSGNRVLSGQSKK